LAWIEGDGNIQGKRKALHLPNAKMAWLCTLAAVDPFYKSRIKFQNSYKGGPSKSNIPID